MQARKQHSDFRVCFEKHTIIAKLSKHVQSASETCFAIHFIPGHFGQANGPMALEIFGPTTRP
jgi:hypothetical protein